MFSSGGLLSRLSRSRQHLSDGLMGLFKSQAKIDDSLFEDIEDQLLMADLGVAASQKLVEQIRHDARSNNYANGEQLLGALKQAMVEILQPPSDAIREQVDKSPEVILMVGVNGVGKTTTLAKLGHRFKTQGSSVMFAACDTFRAAAIQQLQSWGETLEIPVIAQSHGADAAAVAFDALNAARARKIDWLLIDSAGRQHTHGDLMDQLGKIKRVLGRFDPDCPQQVWMTVDAGNGQNVLSQVEHFNQVLPLTGLCVTKLDGTARGGVIVALADRFKIPVRYIGVGESVDDLRPFDAREFVEALLPDIETSG